jgi:hypothetical protein
MSRPKPKKKISIKSIILEEIIISYINEILNKTLKTNYEKVLNIAQPNKLKCDIYKFKTNNNYYYDVDFCEKYVKFDQIQLINGDYLPNRFGENLTKGIIIGFTPIEIKDIDVSDKIEKTLEDPYIKRTDRFEQYEVLTKVAYLIEEYIKNNILYDIYIVEKETNPVNLKIYKQMFNKIFNNQFDEYESKDAFYYILKY